MSIIQKDITYLESEKELPDTFNKQGDFLRVKTDGSGDPEWVDPDTSDISFNRILLGDGSVSQPSLTFQNEANTDSGIYRDAENSVSISAGGLQRLQVTNANVTVGTTTNNADLIVRGNVATNSFYAGNGAQATPSFSFSTSGGNDTGMYYTFDTLDRLRFSAGGTFALEMSSGQSFFNNRLLANSTGTNTTPAFIFHNDSSTTGYSGQRTNPSTDPRLWAIVNGVQATELTTTNFNIGLNTANNTQMKTLNQNGPSNFNTYPIAYSSFIQPQTNTGLGLGTGAYRSIIFDGTNYVATNSTATAGQTRLAYTTSLTNPTTWNTITNTALNMNNCGSVAFGNGIYVVIGTVASQTRQCFTSTNLTTWTQVPNTAPWTTIVTLIKCRFINNQFLVLANNSQVFYSSDGITWAIRSINATNYNLNDVVYSPELQMYVFATGQTAVLHFTGTSIGATTTATAVTSGVQAMNTITYSPKLGMFLGPNNAVNTNMIWSKNGTTWNNTTVTATPNNIINSNEIIWVNDFGGMFINCQFNSSNIAVSRDGFNWQVFPYGITMNSVSLCYNSVNKVLLIGGSATTAMTFRNMLTDFNNFVDYDSVYNTFNSNTRFADTIEYQSQLITTTSSNNHFTVSEFNRSVININTTSANANIYLQGISFNGRIGTKFTIQKTISSNNNLRIHGYENCRIITPFGEVVSFNHQSSPQTYSIIPAGYFGNFDLTRVDDTVNGTWLIDNVDIYDSTGVEYKLDDLTVAGNIQANIIKVPTSTTPSILFNTTGSTDYGIGGDPTRTTIYSANKPIINASYNTILLFDASWTGELNVNNYGSLTNISQSIGSGSFDSDTFNKDCIQINATTGNCQINLKAPASVLLGNTKRFYKSNTANKISLFALGSTITLISRLGREQRTTGNEFTTAFPDTTNKNIIFELVYVAVNTFYCNILQIFDGSSISNTLGDTNINGRLIVADTSVQGTDFQSNVTVSGTFLNFKESIKDISATSGLAVTSANILTYAKYNYITTSSTNFYIELNNLNNAAFDNTTLYFCGAEDYTGTTLYIDNQMGTGNIVKVYKNGGITTLNNTDDTTIDKDQWVRCTYKHNYRGGNNYWLCHEYNSSA